MPPHFPLALDEVTYGRYIYVVRPDEVLRVVRELHAQNLRVWVDSGWGVDALLHEVTRAHDDVDLVVELNELPEVYGCLSNLGYSVVEDLAPVRVVLHAPDGRQVDLHPVVFAANRFGLDLPPPYVNRIPSSRVIIGICSWPRYCGGATSHTDRTRETPPHTQATDLQRTTI